VLFSVCVGACLLRGHVCLEARLCGAPPQVTTVDKYQGQQNDYVLLSLVRTNHFGHLRDVRRLGERPAGCGSKRCHPAPSHAFVVLPA
jgi:hypothetical protein